MIYTSGGETNDWTSALLGQDCNTIDFKFKLPSDRPSEIQLYREINLKAASVLLAYIDSETNIVDLAIEMGMAKGYGLKIILAIEDQEGFVKGRYASLIALADATISSIDSAIALYKGTKNL